MKKEILLLLTLSALMNVANAADEKEISPWTSSVELGFIRTTGNTETQTLTLKSDVIYEVAKWRHKGYFEGYGSATEDGTGQKVVSAERYELSGKSDYKINEYDYIFGIVKLQKDRFGGFEYEHIVSVGYGHKVLKREDMELDMEIGPGIRFFKPDGLGSDNEAILRLSADYWWQISDNSKFTQELATDIGEVITSTKSVTGIQADISGNLAMKFTYTIRNKTKVPVNTKKTDTELGVTLVYNF